MAELEIHHDDNQHGTDPMGHRVGALAAVLAALLALVTISSHRTHTESIVLRTEANDQWQYYQSRRIKFHNLELGEDLIAVLDAKSDAAAKILQKYRAEKERYKQEGKTIQDEAREKQREAQRAERKALRYDLGEGLLEIGLILTSLYFLSRRKFFPVMGLLGGIAGLLVAATGLWVS